MKSIYKTALIFCSVAAVLILVLVVKLNPAQKQKERIKIVPIPVIENTDAGGTLFTPFYQATKSPMPENCKTSQSYEYLEEYVQEDFVLHSQVKLDDRHYKLKDILYFRDLVLEAWTRKFEITPEDVLLFRYETNNTHVIYARTLESFRDLTNREMDPRTVACLVNEKYSCFKSPTDNMFTMILAPVSYHISREGTTIPKELAPASIFIIHEYIHWLSSIVDGRMDSEHKNKKLWIKDNPENSVQTIAFRLHLRAISSDSAYQQITPMLSL